MDFDSEDEIDLVLLAVALIKSKKKRNKRRIWVQDMYKNWDNEGIIASSTLFHALDFARLSFYSDIPLSYRHGYFRTSSANSSFLMFTFS